MNQWQDLNWGAIKGRESDTRGPYNFPHSSASTLSLRINERTNKSWSPRVNVPNLLVCKENRWREGQNREVSKNIPCLTFDNEKDYSSVFLSFPHFYYSNLHSFYDLKWIKCINVRRERERVDEWESTTGSVTAHMNKERNELERERPTLTAWNIENIREWKKKNGRIDVEMKKVREPFGKSSLRSFSYYYCLCFVPLATSNILHLDFILPILCSILWLAQGSDKYQYLIRPAITFSDKALKM